MKIIYYSGSFQLIFVACTLPNIQPIVRQIREKFNLEVQVNSIYCYLYFPAGENYRSDVESTAVNRSKIFEKLIIKMYKNIIELVFTVVL